VSKEIIKMANREFLMLSKDFDVTRHRVGGMYWSEKLDGMRAIWIPAAAGIEVSRLGFVNTEKDRKSTEIVATGLFSRYGKVIYAPQWFTDKLPRFPLDGELYTGRQQWNELISIVKQHEPDERWRGVRYKVFDSPTYEMLFADGKINGTIFKKQMCFKEVEKDIGIGLKVEHGHKKYDNFDFVYKMLIKQSQGWDSSVVQVHELTELPWFTEKAIVELYKQLAVITDEGGEGIILRHISAPWEPIRSQWSLKVKYTHDAEATIIGYKMGNGKHEGRLGSLCCIFNGVRFDVSGFTDLERVVVNAESIGAGNITTRPISNKFLLGSVITFTYRELSPDGVPKEARYKRNKVIE